MGNTKIGNQRSYLTSKMTGAVISYRKKAFLTNKYKIYERERKARIELKDYMVVKYLRASKWSLEDITPELIELKRQQIILNRQIKWQTSKM